jgi:formate dehydrogenase major subunit
MSNAINEIDNTDLVFIFGYNPADSHPIVANHVIRAKQNGAKIIVCDPRKIETARIADMHIALKNGSNIALLNAMGHVIIEENLYDQAFVASRTEGFEEYRKIVEGYTPESVEAITGVSAQEIRQAARMYAGAKTAAILWGMGVTQFYQGVETVRSLTSLAMLTGNLGKAHVGVNPVRGQNNVQGPAIWARCRIPIQDISTSNSRKTARNSRKPGGRKPAGTHRLSHQRAAAPCGAR